MTNARLLRATASLIALSLGACSLAPKNITPSAPVSASWPVGDAYLIQSEADLPVVSHAEVFRDPRLQDLIARALDTNRDIRIAAANLAAARAQVRVIRADQFPAIGVNAGATYTDRGNTTQGAGSGGDLWSYSAQGRITNFELDFFGKYANATEAQRNRALATEASARTVRLSLIAELAQAWAIYGADRDLLQLAQSTAANARRAVELTSARLRGGVSPRTDVRQAEQVLETALGDVARQRAALAQDANIIRLLVGAEFEDSLLPTGMSDVIGSIAPLPAGVSSEVLLRRPDVVEAEYALRAANANIGVARAQLFPSITLTGLVGFASDALGALFNDGAFTWSGGGSAGYSVFNAGGRSAQVEVSKAQRDAAVAGYERTIQIAFREVSDALADQGTLTERLRAASANTTASADTAKLTDARYRYGVDSFLASLDAQRSLYAAQRAEISTRLAMASNRIALFRVLGGDTTTAIPAVPAR